MAVYPFDRPEFTRRRLWWYAAVGHGSPYPPVKPLLVFPANDIETQGREVATDLPADWLFQQLTDEEGDDTFIRGVPVPGRVSGRLSRSGKADMVVRCKVSAAVELTCARCLGPVPVDVKAEISLLLKPRAPEVRKPTRKKKPVVTTSGDPAVDASASTNPGAKASRARAAQAKPPPKAKQHVEYEFSSDEADQDEYDGEKVILDGFVRESIFLELPAFPVCREDCEGVVDPRAPTFSRAPQHTKAPRSEPETTSDSNGAGRETPPPKEGRHRPFANLGEILSGQKAPEGIVLHSDESTGNSPRPSQAEVRRVARARQRSKPMIRSSILGRSKKN